MANDFRSARFWASALIKPALYDGARAIDATLGNGHDALWLCQRVGPAGRVYGFDIQKEAVERATARLTEAGLQTRARLFCQGHETMAAAVPEPVDVIMFNLGWLPGAEHEVTTRVDTTLAAAEAALTLLKPDGLLTLCVYPGHDEGARELDALTQWACALDPARFDAMHRHYMNQPNCPPHLIAIRRKRQKGEG